MIQKIKKLLGLKQKPKATINVDVSKEEVEEMLDEISEEKMPVIGDTKDTLPMYIGVETQQKIAEIIREDMSERMKEKYDVKAVLPDKAILVRKEVSEE